MSAPFGTERSSDRSAQASLVATGARTFPQLSFGTEDLLDAAIHPTPDTYLERSNDRSGAPQSDTEGERTFVQEFEVDGVPVFAHVDECGEYIAFTLLDPDGGPTTLHQDHLTRDQLIDFYVLRERCLQLDEARIPEQWAPDERSNDGGARSPGDDGERTFPPVDVWTARQQRIA